MNQTQINNKLDIELTTLEYKAHALSYLIDELCNTFFNEYNNPNSKLTKEEQNYCIIFNFDKFTTVANMANEYTYRMNKQIELINSIIN
ncbi:MAG: hypothetical protein R3Y27_00645 [Clostridia bacterium]